MDIESIARTIREQALAEDGYRVITDLEILDLRDQIAKIYLHAGRYMAGARDGVAIANYRKMELIENANS